MPKDKGRRPYKNGDSLQKQFCRDFLFNEVIQTFNSNKKLNICTLPNLNFSLESRLMMKYKSKVYLIERDNSIVHKIANYWAGINDVEVYHGDFFDLTIDSPVHFNFIWADFCCSLNVELINKTISLLNGQKSHDCIYACTFLRAREKRDLSIIYKCSDLNKIRRVLFPETILKHTGFRLINHIEYNAQTWGSHMITYLFTNNLKKER